MGFVVPVGVFGSMILTQLAVNSIYTEGNYYGENLWPKIIAYSVAFLLVLFVGLYVRKNSTVVVEDDLGKEHTVIKRHDFFYIPIIIWAALIPLLAVLVSLK